MENLLPNEELDPVQHAGTELPDTARSIAVTFKVPVRTDYGYSSTLKQTVTKRGFYTNICSDICGDHYSIPPDWQHFNGIYLPHGWGGWRPTPKEVLYWQEIIVKE